MGSPQLSRRSDAVSPTSDHLLHASQTENRTGSATPARIPYGSSFSKITLLDGPSDRKKTLRPPSSPVEPLLSRCHLGHIRLHPAHQPLVQGLALPFSCAAYFR